MKAPQALIALISLTWVIHSQGTQAQHLVFALAVLQVYLFHVLLVDLSPN